MKRKYSKPEILTIEFGTVNILAASVVAYRGNFSNKSEQGGTTDASINRSAWGNVWN